jgi:hypothetical protein
MRHPVFSALRLGKAGEVGLCALTTVRTGIRASTIGSVNIPSLTAPHFAAARRRIWFSLAAQDGRFLHATLPSYGAECLRSVRRDGVPPWLSADEFFLKIKVKHFSNRGCENR